MRDFIRFIDSYKNFLIFIVLQLICFTLIFRTTVFQRGVLLSSINSVSGGAYEWREGMRNYFYLAEENEQLAEENLELLYRSRLSYEKVDRDYAIIDDTLFQRRYTFQYANVINSSKSSLKNHLTLDKGRKHGVVPRMGVLSDMALLGRVDKVTENYSLVTPVIHIDFNVSARLESSGYFGALSWAGDDYRYAQLNEIPKEAVVELGDRVVTRGAGSLYPAGLDIGEVSNVEIDEGGNFLSIQVKLQVDMSKLNKVMLIKDLHIEELDSLSIDIEDQ